MVRHTIRLLAAVLLASALAACGSGSSGDGVATLGDGASAGDGSEAEETDPEDAMLAFTECMREHGIDLPDPEVREDSGERGVTIGGPVAARSGEKLPDPEDDDFKEAQEACGGLLEDAMGSVELSPEEEAEARDNALAFAQCMRDHGVDMPDPTFGEGGRVEIRAEGGDDEAPPFDDEDFQAANEACAEELGGKGGFMGGGTKARGGEG